MRITRVFEFDAAHRVMHERVKCFNLHGHRWKVELTFDSPHNEAIGYAIDFKEIKRIAGDYLDTYFDHGMIVNPMDSDIIDLCKSNGFKLYVMGRGVYPDLNPSAENIAEEIYYVMERLFSIDTDGVRIYSVKLFETPNCWVECPFADATASAAFIEGIDSFRQSKGTMVYDQRLM